MTIQTLTSFAKVRGTAAERAAMRLSDIPQNQEIEFTETDTGDVYTGSRDGWYQGGANGAALVDASPNIVAITASDVTTYDPPLLGIRVGTTAGNVKVVSDGITVTITGVQIGETIPGSITKVFSTDTTAAGITGWQR
jgi:hypothetical protein